jgi:hypothetical protein
MMRDYVVVAAHNAATAPQGRALQRHARYRPPRIHRRLFTIILSRTIKRHWLTSSTKQVCCYADKKTLSLTKRDDPEWQTIFTYEQPTPARPTLAGRSDGHSVQAKLRRAEMSQFLLTGRASTGLTSTLSTAERKRRA